MGFKPLLFQRLIGAERPNKLLPRTLDHDEDRSRVGGGANLLGADLQERVKNGNVGIKSGRWRQQISGGVA